MSKLTYNNKLMHCLFA